MTAFVDRGGAARFVGVTVATFLIFLTLSCLSYLSRILLELGLPPEKSGIILSSGAIPVLLFSLMAGNIVHRTGTRLLACAGGGLVYVGYASLQWTASAATFPLAVVSAAVMIGGIGLFLPAAFLLVRSLVKPEKLVHYVGIYGSMQLLPALFGPALADLIFATYGIANYFIITGIPAFGGMLLLLTIKTKEPTTLPEDGSSAEPYWTLALKARVAIPCLAGIASGGVFGAINAFVVLALVKGDTEVIFFFAPFVTAYMVTRFILLGYLERFQRGHVASTGVLLMTLGVCVLWSAAGNVAGTIAAAVIFGIGFSITYPVSVVWISELFTPEHRAKPVALFNGLYAFSMHGSPILAGAVLAYGGFPLYFATVAVAGAVPAALILIYGADVTQETPVPDA